VPVIVVETVSVTVTDCVPAVPNVSEKGCTPSFLDVKV